MSLQRSLSFSLAAILAVGGTAIVIRSRFASGPAPAPLPVQQARRENLQTPALASVATQTAGVSARAPIEAMSPALQAAVADPNPTERSEQILSALRRWGREDVAAASSWALKQSLVPKAMAIAEVINGSASANSELTIRFVTELSATDPANALEYGTDLIFALGEAGKPAVAAEWAKNSKEVNIDWLTGAFDRWAGIEPESALLNALEIEDPARRGPAVAAAISGWSKTTPNKLAEYAITFPAGPEKDRALVTALRAWAESEPQVVADWMLAHRSALAGVQNLAIINDD